MSYYFYNNAISILSAMIGCFCMLSLQVSKIKKLDCFFLTSLTTFLYLPVMFFFITDIDLFIKIVVLFFMGCACVFVVSIDRMEESTKYNTCDGNSDKCTTKKNYEETAQEIFNRKKRMLSSADDPVINKTIYNRFQLSELGKKGILNFEITGDFSDYDFSEFVMINVKFIKCNLTRAKFNYSNMTNTTFLRCKLLEADFSDTCIFNADFINPSFLYSAVFDRTKMQNIRQNTKLIDKKLMEVAREYEYTGSRGSGCGGECHGCPIRKGCEGSLSFCG